MNRAILSTRELVRDGMSGHAIARAVRSGDLTRVRRGFYAHRGTHPQIVSAARFGSVTCVTGLALYGVWIIRHPEIHVRVGRDSRAGARGVRLHRTGPAARLPIETPIDCVVRFVRCCPDLEIVVALDSALHLGVVTRSQLDARLSHTHRGRRLLSRIDGRAESGTESIVRVRLRAHGVKLRIQVPITGIGRVDLLVGERLVIEVDGRQWHDRESTFESDRRRDAALVVRGYIVLRYSYARVMNEWDAVEQEVLSVIRRDRHLARRGGNSHRNA